MLLNLVVSRSNHNYLFDDLVRTNGCSNRLRRSLNKKSKRNEKETVSSSGFVCFCWQRKILFRVLLCSISVVFDHLEIQLTYEVFIKWTFPKLKHPGFESMWGWYSFIFPKFYTFFKGQIRKVSNQLHRNLKAKKVERGTFKQGLLHWSNWLF